MNARLFFARHPRRNPHWLTRLARFIGDYRFYRRLKHSHAAAWEKACNTMPRRPR